MHKNDWVELKNILDQYKIPYGGKKAKRAKRKVQRKIAKVLKQFKEN